MKITAQTKKKIIAILREIFPNAQFYILGSRARDADPDALDVDIAIDDGKKIQSPLVKEARASLQALDLNFEIDVLDLHAVPEKTQIFIKQFGTSWE